MLDLFFDVRELFEKMAEEKGIKITASIHQAETVFADSEMLKTIMRNLISNAIKFTDRGGSIKIKANQVESNLMITISDNGVGMTSSNQKKTV